MPRPRKHAQNDALLQAALEGLEGQRQRIDNQINQVRSMLGIVSARAGGPSGNNGHSNGAVPNGNKRRLSDAARERIAEAQKRRWAEYRKASSAANPS